MLLHAANLRLSLSMAQPNDLRITLAEVAPFADSGCTACFGEGYTQPKRAIQPIPCACATRGFTQKHARDITFIRGFATWLIGRRPKMLQPAT